MKTKKRFNFRKICYLMLVLSVLGGISMSYCFGNELKENNVKNAKKIVKSSACVGRAYFEEIIKERISGLELLAGKLSNIDVSNRSEMSSACKNLKRYFDDVSLVGTNGVRLYGNCVYKEIAGSEGYEKALSGVSNVATEVTLNYIGNDEICFFVPVKSGKAVQSVLVGSMLLENMSNKLYNSGLSKEGYVLILSENGDIISATRDICDIGLEADTNFFSYLNDSRIFDGYDSQKVRNRIKDNSETDFQYRYNKKNYVITTIPVSVNGWSFAYISKGRNKKIADIVITSKCMNYLRMLCVELLIIMVMLIYAARSRQRLIKIQETYDAVSRIDKTMIFEYTFSPKRFALKDKFENIIDKDMKPLMGEAVYDVYEYIHPDDLSIRRKLRKFFESKETFFTSEVRVKGKTGEYDWYRVSGCLEREENGSPKYFAGKLTDASKQITMEKNLVQRAENDMLTGVLNKKTMEEKMSNLLSENKADRYYIFYMVDLDNFKNVNDTLGHIYGDKAIADTGAELTKVFKNQALIGRLGGDEFAVCSVYDAFDEESLKNYIIKKAGQIKEANRRSYTDGANVVNITSSIGISVAPVDGTDFETIYKKADSALYKSKKTGKDRYTLFNGELWEI